MPSSTLSSIYGWSLYLIASGAFLALASTPVMVEAQAAKTLEVEAVLEGYAATLNSLTPGMTVVLRSPSTQGSMRVWLHGHAITGAIGSILVERNLVWSNPLYVIDPDVRYTVALSSGELTLVEKGLS